MSDDGNTPQRPNAKYRLSKGDDGKNPYGEGIVYHYNRERRLEKAPQAVRDLYKDDIKPGRLGFFRSLTGDRSRLITFSVIVVTCIVIYALMIMGKIDNSYALEGNIIEFTAAARDGMTVIVMTKTIKDENSSSVYTGAIDIAISPVSKEDTGDFPVFYHRVFFSLDNVQEFRFIAPFDSKDLLAVIQSERSSLNIKFKVE